jgi:CRP-like cAMP-binding protein
MFSPRRLCQHRGNVHAFAPAPVPAPPVPARSAPGALAGALLAAALPEVPPALADRAAPLFARAEVRKGASLVRQGDVWRHAILVERGLIRLFFVRRDGREFNKNFYADGAIVCPLTPAMWGEPSLFGITALEPCALWRADAAALRQALGDAWAPVQRELLARLVTHTLQREHDLLAHDGRERYLAFRRRHPVLAERVPLAQLATYLGLTDVSLSRIRRALRVSPAARVRKP